MKKTIIAGRTVPAIGMGTWHMGEDPARRAQEIETIRTGIEAGVQVIDTAEMYGKGKAESLLGEALKTAERSRLFLISKVYPWNASKKQLPISLDKSLQRLGTEYLDLYLLHWIGSVPFEETVEAMEEAKKSGKIKNWGVSNFDTSEMKELWKVKNGKNCVVNEVLYNLGSRGIEFDLLPWMREQNLPLIAYSPLAQGDSLGNRFHEDPLLQKIAAAHQCSIEQLLLAWAIRDGKTIAIPQAGTPQHVKDNYAAGSLVLSAEEWQELAEHYPKPTTKQSLAVL